MSATQTTDVLIVGAGVIGLSLGWELSRRGLRVTVLERGDVGREASWAGAGMIPPRLSHWGSAYPSADHPAAKQDDPLQALLQLSRELHPQWAAELRELTGIDNEYRRCGAWYLAANDMETAALRAQYAALFAAGATATWHERADLPPLLSPAWHAGYFAAEEAQIRNPRHLQALLAAIKTRGVLLETHTEPRSIKRLDSGSIDVTTDNGHWSAAQVVLCGGAWSESLGKVLCSHIPVRPIRGQILLLETPLDLQAIVNHGTRYLVPRSGGLVLVGSTEEDVGFLKENTPAGMTALRTFAGQVIPGLDNAPERKAWSGLRPASARPWISRLPGWNNAWTATGHYRHGLALSPGTAAALATMICGEEPLLEMTWFQLPG